MPAKRLLRYAEQMEDGGLSAALDRAERALARVERAIAERPAQSGRDDQLRARVREAVAELDQLIRSGKR